MQHSALFEKLLHLPSASEKPEVLMDFAKNIEKYDKIEVSTSLYIF